MHLEGMARRTLEGAGPPPRTYLGPLLCHVAPVLRLRWAYREVMCPTDLSWSVAGPILRLCCAHLAPFGHILDYVEPVLGACGPCQVLEP